LKRTSGGIGYAWSCSQEENPEAVLGRQSATFANQLNTGYTFRERLVLQA
jgi:hypothetical protein